RAINRRLQLRPTAVGFAVSRFALPQRRSIFEPDRLEILEQALASPFTSEAALAVTAKAAGRVKQIGTVDPYDSRLELRGHLQGNIDALAPHTGGQPVNRIVREFDGFSGSAETHRGKHRAEDFLLRNDRSRMDVAEQGWWKIETVRGHLNLRLPAGCAFGDPLIDEAVDTIELYASNDCADVDRFVQRGADPQSAHAVTNFFDERLGNALLHQQA